MNNQQQRVIYWKKHPDYPEILISSDGRVVSRDPERKRRHKVKGPMELLGEVDIYGYRTITFYNNGQRIRKKAHQLVASAYVPNPESKKYVNHIDNNPANNDFSNLEWVTIAENNKGEFRKCIWVSDEVVYQVLKERFVDSKSIREVSAKFGVKANSVRDWERGRTRRSVKDSVFNDYGITPVELSSSKQGNQRS